MVAAHAGHDTVFSVLGAAARKRGPRSLAAQLVLSVATAAAILATAPHWWSLAFLAGWSAAYAAWGLLARVADARGQHGRPLDAILLTIATAGTILAIAGVIGVGLAMYSGNAGGIKNACGAHSTNRMCEAWKNPVPASGKIIR